MTNPNKQGQYTHIRTYVRKLIIAHPLTTTILALPDPLLPRSSTVSTVSPSSTAGVISRRWEGLCRKQHKPKYTMYKHYSTQYCTSRHCCMPPQHTQVTGPPTGKYICMSYCVSMSELWALWAQDYMPMHAMNIILSADTYSLDKW